MSIIHTVLSPSQLKCLSQKDNDYFRRRLEDNSMLNNLLNKPVNKHLLDELQCILDRQPVARRKTERYERSGKVSVYKDGKLIRIEHADGRVMKEVA